MRFRLGVYGIATSKNKIILVKRTSGIHEGLWHLPGGGVEWGETPEETLRREFLEEVGLSFRNWKWHANLSYCQNGKDPWHHIGLVYQVRGLQKAQNGTDIFQWFSISEISTEILTPFAKDCVNFLKQKINLPIQLQRV